MPATIRKLSASDRDEINEISRHIWDGHDYLPAVAHEWLRDKNCHFYGMEADDHIVAVGNLRVIENGRTGWMEGLRVHPKYRGKGYANAITKYLVDEAKHLGIARLRYTTGSRNKASLKLAKMAGFSILFKMTVAWIIKPKKISQIHGYPTIRETTPATTYRMLRSEPSMIPQRILVFDWKALDFNLENLKQIGKTHHFLAALRNESIDSLSFGFPRQEPSQTRWSFTVYSKDRQGFEAQLFHNLATAMNHDFTSIMTTFENRFEKPFKKLDFQAEEKGIMHIVLVEKQIRFRKRKSTDGRS